MAAPKGNQYAKGGPGGGRPPEYKTKYAKQVIKACEAGFTDREIADLLGVTEKTINQWKHTHQEFRLALRTGKEPANERVERSLYHRAIGYSFDAVKIFNGSDGPVMVPYTEHVPPDTNAGKFWLTNRRSERWRDKVDHEHGGPNGGPIMVGQVTDEDRAKALAVFLAKTDANKGKSE